ncbi:sulfite exporter TauE/SafE family protein [Desulforhopalus singaporensis]|nr:sulfite exporter TauE/SafE family protein [Desulforhopalus singaporensis]
MGGAVQGLTGFGAGLVVIPLLCLIIDVKEVVPLCNLNLVVINIFLAYTLRGCLDKRKILPLICGAVPGIMIGTIFFDAINPELVRASLGTLLILNSLYNLLVRPRPLKLPSWAGYFAGLCAGTIASLLSAGGPPLIVYTTLTNWTKNEIRSTLIGVFLFNSSFTALAHAANGISSLLTLQYCTVTIPMILLGTFIGARFTDRINRRLYLKIIHFFLIIMGTIMVAG